MPREVLTPPEELLVEDTLPLLEDDLEYEAEAALDCELAEGLTLVAETLEVATLEGDAPDVPALEFATLEWAAPEAVATPLRELPPRGEADEEATPCRPAPGLVVLREAYRMSLSLIIMGPTGWWCQPGPYQGSYQAGSYQAGPYQGLCQL